MPPLYEAIYEVVCCIPPGKVATYGQIAQILGRGTARLVGYAMAATPGETAIPWHRVINAQGKVSPRSGGKGHVLQQALLEAEGVCFDAHQRVDFAKFGWPGLDSRKI